MKGLPLQRRTLALIAVIVPLLGLFIYVGLRSGPLRRLLRTINLCRRTSPGSHAGERIPIPAKAGYHLAFDVRLRCASMAVEHGRECGW